MSNSTARNCVLLFLASLALFFFRITSPPGYSFDEIMYVPFAQNELASGTLFTNQAHPPLAQLLIALSMKIFGDKPLGWRFLAAIFGGLTVSGVYCWALAIFRRHEIALWITVVALLNQMLFVLARTGQLDIFVMAFMTWGIAAFCAAWCRDVEPRLARALLLFSGAMFGLMTACKWLGIVAVGIAFGLLVFAIVARRFAFGPRSEVANGASDEPWLSADILPCIGLGTAFLAFVLAPAVAYAAAHLPLLLLPGPESTLRGIVQNQLIIWQNHTAASWGPWHPPKIQMSQWYQWPLGWRPVWFYFDRAGSYQYGSAVVLSGNIIVMWAGLASIAACVWLWIKFRSRRAFLALVWWVVLWASWAVVPIKTGFLYYYAPALLALGPALGVCVARWPDRKLFGMPWHWTLAAAAAVWFAVHYPDLTAIRMPLAWFGR
jgi:dolichyl-phosphate-mannose--protein O-mannosyl transferase